MSKEDEVRKLRRHQQVLLELANLATGKVGAGSFFDVAVKLVARAVEINHVKLMRYRAVNGDLLVEAGVGWRPGVVGHATFDTDLASPPGRTFQTGQPVVITDLGQDTEFRISNVLREHGIVSLLNVPVQIDGATWGVVEVDSTKIREFSPDTENFLLAVASIIAAAVRREKVDQQHEQAVAQVALEVRRHEVLLHEMQHRMKNNFQTILSMVALQMARMEAGKDVLAKIADSIRAMSLAHDQLAPTQGGELVHLPTYLRALTRNIQKPLDTVTIEVKVDELNLPIEYAVPVGLIINELVTNSVKHAFDENGGTVQVELCGFGQGMIRLKVADNGRGIDPSRPGGSGLRLIDGLARQVRGQVERESGGKGTTTCVSFTLPQ
ncbi:sensor histidine kinase [Geminicoccus roseus]|uniref:sensor histidine kinase n=1 Tax=Geminicoccus roseus TaxID=404900 RepID=UPI00041F02CF|nr:GAF domain-containing protein [Geminicoccus roseus]